MILLPIALVAEAKAATPTAQAARASSRVPLSNFEQKSVPPVTRNIICPSRRYACLWRSPSHPLPGFRH